MRANNGFMNAPQQFWKPEMKQTTCAMANERGNSTEKRQGNSHLSSHGHWNEKQGWQGPPAHHNHERPRRRGCKTRNRVKILLPFLNTGESTPTAPLPPTRLPSPCIRGASSQTTFFPVKSIYVCEKWEFGLLLEFLSSLY